MKREQDTNMEENEKHPPLRGVRDHHQNDTVPSPQINIPANTTVAMDEISREMLDIKRYPLSPSLGMTQLSNGMAWNECAFLLVESDVPQLKSVGYWAVGRSHRGFLAMMSTRHCFVEAIHCDSRCSLAYCGLGVSLAPLETVTLKDGRTLNKQQCYEAAIDCNYDNRNATAYFNLGVLLKAERATVTLKDGRSLNAQRCYVKAIQCDNRNSTAYFALGATLKAERKTVTLKDARTLNEKQCYLEAIHCDNRNSLAYHNLGATLAAGESVTRQDGRTLNQQERFMELIDCDFRTSTAHSNVRRVQHAGASLNSRQGFMEAVDYNKCYSSAFCAFGRSLEPVMLTDGRTLNQQQCFVEAIDCDTRCGDAYCSLGVSLNVGDAQRRSHAESAAVLRGGDRLRQPQQHRVL